MHTEVVGSAGRICFQWRARKTFNRLKEHLTFCFYYLSLYPSSSLHTPFVVVAHCTIYVIPFIIICLPFSLTPPHTSEHILNVTANILLMPFLHTDDNNNKNSNNNFNIILFPQSIYSDRLKYSSADIKNRFYLFTLRQISLRYTHAIILSCQSRYFLELSYNAQRATRFSD